MYPSETIEEMNKLSKVAFGSKSKWRKILEKGVMVPETEDTTVFVPDENHPEGGVTKQIKTPVKRFDSEGRGIYQNIMKRFTLEETKTWMLQIIAERQEAYRQMVKKQEDNRKREELARAVTGSSI
jgi:hypothetical protein